MARTTDTLSLTADQLAQLRRSPAPRRALVARTNRRHNLSLVLQTLWSNGPHTRPQLAAALRLSSPTVTALVEELLRDELIEDLGVIVPSRVGKPPSSVGIAWEANGVVVVDLTGEGALSGSVVTLAGETVHTRELEIGAATGQEALDAAAGFAATLCADAPVRVLGVGVASPGLVDAEGSVRVADRLGWTDVDVVGALTAATGQAVVVRNDVDCMALGRRRVQQRSPRDLVVVALENGVGATVIIDGRTIPGERFAAGEIGHVRADPDGELCVCGRRGCLDQIVSARRLVPALRDADAAEHERILRRAGAALGGVLGPVLSMLNISEVLVIGPAELYEGAFADELRSTLREGNLPALTDDLEVELAADSARLILLGAAAAVFEAELGVL